MKSPLSARSPGSTPTPGQDPWKVAGSFIHRSGAPQLYKPEDDVQRNAEVFLGSLEEFVMKAWPKTDPTPVLWNWHVVAICDKLEALH